MAQPLFSLTDQETISGFILLDDEPSPELIAIFRRKGFPLESSAINTWYNRADGRSSYHILTQPNSPENSYLIIREGGSYAVYKAYSRCGNENSYAQVSSGDFNMALSDPSYQVLYFSNCIIKGLVEYLAVGTEIDKLLICLSCSFTGNVHLADVEFQQAIDFDETTFNSYVGFRRTTFKEYAGFESTIFEDGGVDFGGTFLKEARFQGSTFQKEAGFWETSFKGCTSFANTNFRSYAIFSDTTFEEDASFWGTIFEGNASFTRATFKKEAEFERASFRILADFSRAVIEKPILFDGVRYWPNSVGQWLRRKVLNEWSGPLMWRVSKEEENPRWVTQRLLSQKKYPGGRPAKPTKFLIESENISGMSNPFLKRYVADMQFIGSLSTGFPILGWFWQLSSDYGRSLALWSAWSVMIALIFGLVFSDLPLPQFLHGSFPGDLLIAANPEIKVHSTDNWFSGFYFSIVTFTTLGFGDVTPNNFAAQIWIIIEVIWGYVMLGGLISIMGNKLARRS